MTLSNSMKVSLRATGLAPTHIHHQLRLWTHSPRLGHPLNKRAPVCAATQDNNKGEFLRLLPLSAGALGITSVLANRLISGIEPTLLASSSQSRSDVIVIFISAVLALTGLQWLSLKPKVPVKVDLDGDIVDYYDSSLSSDARDELEGAWNAIKKATRAEIFVLFDKNKCIMHKGYISRGAIPGQSIPGAICQAVVTSGSSNYLGNLSLFPGRAEFFTYCPVNTQSVVIQPYGNNGCIVIGAATQRGFTVLDQAWISVWIDKIVVAIENNNNQ